MGAGWEIWRQVKSSSRKAPEAVGEGRWPVAASVLAFHSINRKFRVWGWGWAVPMSGWQEALWSSLGLGLCLSPLGASEECHHLGPTLGVRIKERDAGGPGWRQDPGREGASPGPSERLWLQGRAGPSSDWTGVRHRLGGQSHRPQVPRRCVCVLAGGFLWWLSDPPQACIRAVPGSPAPVLSYSESWDPSDEKLEFENPRP